MYITSSQVPSGEWMPIDVTPNARISTHKCREKVVSRPDVGIHRYRHPSGTPLSSSSINGKEHYGVLGCGPGHPSTPDWFWLIRAYSELHVPFLFYSCRIVLLQVFQVLPQYKPPILKLKFHFMYFILKKWCQNNEGHCRIKRKNLLYLLSFLLSFCICLQVLSFKKICLLWNQKLVFVYFPVDHENQLSVGQLKHKTDKKTLYLSNTKLAEWYTRNTYVWYYIKTLK